MAFEKVFTPPPETEMIPGFLFDAVVDGKLEVHFSVTYFPDGGYSRSAFFHAPTVAEEDLEEDEREEVAADGSTQPALFELDDLDLE